MVRLVPREKSGVGRAFCKEEEQERGNRRGRGGPYSTEAVVVIVGWQWEITEAKRLENESHSFLRSRLC